MWPDTVYGWTQKEANFLTTIDLINLKKEECGGSANIRVKGIHQKI